MELDEGHLPCSVKHFRFRDDKEYYLGGFITDELAGNWNSAPDNDKMEKAWRDSLGLEQAKVLKKKRKIGKIRICLIKFLISVNAKKRNYSIN